MRSRGIAVDTIRPIKRHSAVTAQSELLFRVGSAGLFSLDGVHPRMVAYGVITQEMINIMRRAQPPRNVTQGLEIMGWADEILDRVRRSVGFNIP